MTLEQIARRAGVSLAVVSRFFHSVADILLAVANTPLHPLGSLPPSPDLRSHLIDRATRASQTLAYMSLRRPVAELVAAAAGDERIGAALTATTAELRAETLEYVKRARSSGEIPPDADGDLIPDLLNGVLYYRLLWDGEWMSEEDIEVTVDLILRGLCAPERGAGVGPAPLGMSTPGLGVYLLGAAAIALRHSSRAS